MRRRPSNRDSKRLARATACSVIAAMAERGHGKYSSGIDCVRGKDTVSGARSGRIGVRNPVKTQWERQRQSENESAFFHGRIISVGFYLRAEKSRFSPVNLGFTPTLEHDWLCENLAHHPLNEIEPVQS
jgi:hypothetical protein